MRRRRRLGRRPARWRRLAFFIAAAAVLTGIFAESRMPAVKADIQQAALSAYAQERITETVQDYLLRQPVTVSTGLVSLDTYTLGAMKSELTGALQEALTGTAASWIPVGNLTGLALLNGHGFKIPVFFAVDGIVSVEFESSLTSAGINRTKYGVTMTVTAELYSSSVSFSDVVTVTTAYPVYESVQQGEVPRYASGLLS
ncbi:MAG: sporulation protein YunB [Hominenteromicrobium sp.]